MKIRNGFVSNSSSSSFIVQVKEDDFLSKLDGKERPFLFTDAQLKKLENMGFQYCKHTYPGRVQELQSMDIVPDPLGRNNKETTQMYLNVVCNQDEVIEKLVKEDIPFIASCHYGTEIVVYKKGQKSVYVLPNLGAEYEIYKMPELLKAKPKVRRISVAKIKSGKWW